MDQYEYRRRMYEELERQNQYQLNGLASLEQAALYRMGVTPPTTARRVEEDPNNLLLLLED